MRGIDTCYLCGLPLDDRTNTFNASGIWTHKVCGVRDTTSRRSYAGRTQSGKALHIIRPADHGWTVCGAGLSQTPKGVFSLAEVNCQRCLAVSRRGVLTNTRTRHMARTRP